MELKLKLMVTTAKSEVSFSINDWGGVINIHFIFIQNLLVPMNVKQTAAGLPHVGHSINLHSSVIKIIYHNYFINLYKNV